MSTPNPTHSVQPWPVADNMYANGQRTVYYVTDASGRQVGGGWATASKAQRVADRMNAEAC